MSHHKNNINLVSLHEFVTKLVERDHPISVAFLLQFLSFPKLGSPTSLSPTDALIKIAYFWIFQSNTKVIKEEKTKCKLEVPFNCSIQNY